MFFKIGIFRGDLVPFKVGSIIALLKWLEIKENEYKKFTPVLILIGPIPTAALNLIQYFKISQSYKIFDNIKDFYESIYFKAAVNSLIYPSLESEVNEDTYDYCLLSEAKNLCGNFLEIEDSILGQSQKIVSNVSKANRVTVHLKNVVGAEGESNANEAIWTQFFSNQILENPNIRFFLIGNDHVPSSVKECENVIIVSEYNKELIVSLGVVSLGRFFMGMSSGPCNYAIYSSHPYLIFKNTNHHRDQIQRVLKDEAIIGAAPNQFFLNIDETVVLLNKYFNKLLVST